MALERRLAAVPARLFTSDGTSLGIVTIGNTSGFYVKQLVFLQANTLSSLSFQIKEILSPTQMVVGPTDNKIGRVNFSNISAFTVALSSAIGATEQSKSPIPDKDHYLDVYEPAPVSADRVLPIDTNGTPYDSSNPMPVTGNISISPISYRKTEITYDSEGNPTDIKRYTGPLISLVLVEEKVIAYDLNGNPISVTKVFP
jgi:hypothetical protein